MQKPFVTIKDLGISPTYAGKVREMCDLGSRLLMITSDRISAFDCVLPTPVPGKGVILNGISAFWFRALSGISPTHFLTDEEAGFPGDLRSMLPEVAGRWMLVAKAERIPIECVVRGHLAGSAIDEYRRTGSVVGVPLPQGIKPYGVLPEPIFTPTTKEDAGHDRPITSRQLADQVGVDLARDLKERSVAIFRSAAAFARERGLVLVDTKFEFGWIDGSLSLIDEALTPDSSRYWDLGKFEGEVPVSLDKEYVRAYLKTLAWDRNPPAPALPPEQIAEAHRRYKLVYDRLGAGGKSPALETV